MNMQREPDKIAKQNTSECRTKIRTVEVETRLVTGGI